MFEISNEEMIFYIFMTVFVSISFVGALYLVRRDNKIKQKIAL